MNRTRTLTGALIAALGVLVAAAAAHAGDVVPKCAGGVLTVRVQEADLHWWIEGSDPTISQGGYVTVHNRGEAPDTEPFATLTGPAPDGGRHELELALGTRWEIMWNNAGPDREPFTDDDHHWPALTIPASACPAAPTSTTTAPTSTTPRPLPTSTVATATPPVPTTLPPDVAPTTAPPVPQMDIDTPELPATGATNTLIVVAVLVVAGGLTARRVARRRPHVRSDRRWSA